MQKDVELTAGANVRLDFALRVGGLAEQVDVAARATMLETRTATQSNLIDDQRVQDLPMNGRNVVALAGTYAGVTAIRASQDTSDGRQGPIMSVNGGNVNHNLFTLNGAVFTHFNQTTGFNPPPPDAVQEIRIQTHNFSAEYGHTAGSQVSIVSKAGTNALSRHGVGVPPQLRVERAQLLPDAQAANRSRIRPAPAPAARSSATSCSGSARTSGCGIARGGLEPDGRADRRAARRRLHGARARSCGTRSTRSPAPRSPTAPARRASPATSSASGCHQPGRRAAC